MPTFQRSLIPAASPVPAIRPVSAPVTAQPAPALQSTGEALTLDALMARQKEAAMRQGQTMQEPVTNIAQGLGQLGWTLVNALQERRAEKDLAAGNADVAKAFGQVDWNTGQMPPEAMQLLMQRDPATGMEMYKTAMALRATQAKQESWDPIPTPQGESGQWFKNARTGETKKVGGGSESGVKDESALRQDVISDPSYKNMAQAVPIWQSMQDAATRNTPQSDLNMIVGLAKLLDPTSVVRQSETGAVELTGNLPASVIAQFKYLTADPSSRLDPEVRKGLLEEGYSRVKGYADAYKQTAATFSEIAIRHGFNPANVALPFAEIKPYGEEPPAPDTPPPPDVVVVPDGAGVVGQTTTQPEGTEASGNDGNTYVVQGGKWALKPKAN